MLRGILGARHAAGLAVILVAGWAWVWAFDAHAAEPAGFVAVALACPVGVTGPDCSRENALDVLTQPVARQGECLKLGELLATHLSLPTGGTHKTICERRKG